MVWEGTASLQQSLKDGGGRVDGQSQRERETFWL